LPRRFFTFFCFDDDCDLCAAGLEFDRHHAVSYADSYRYVGFPAGVLVLVVGLPVFAVLWIRAKLSK